MNLSALRLTEDPPMDQQLGRLAMREEGGFWSAYYAMPGSMEGAVLLGTIRMRFVARPSARSSSWR